MRRKTWLLFLCVLVVAAMALLASSLHDVHFRKGPSFASVLSLSPLEFPKNLVNDIPDVPLWKTLVFWAVICVDVLLFLYFLPPHIRKRLIRLAIRFAVSLLVLFLAFKYHIIEFPSFNLNTASHTAGAGTQTDPSALGIPDFQPPEMTSLTIFLISLMVIVAVLVLLWLGYRWWNRSRSRGASTLDAIAGVARTSLDDLTAGRDWTDVIIRSYIRMGEVVGARRGMHRTRAMTPREFARRLENAGLPPDSVQRLTVLFESARYGGNRSSRAEVKEAVACLGSILQACGEAV